ncbi:Fructosamine kinase family protein, At3g61080 homolog [Richelia intracellularis HH01]|uniref:Fructosamine kinase family protein, At3g61080 homolog n=1 Tax=Richelia intracellularis HH01 TaxID=1165094 RepID=M1X048_9NOST|nr:fructosamine kinase family protein [Richelia intracellularis]CCH68107.1 Fructosamine kinase family protein, At3g61080 homolog [Richelia intracellularis HH01]HAE05173.1 fructosamine kinase family protein [Richelia sp.]
MWNSIDTHISRVTGNRFQSEQKCLVDGGSVNESYIVNNDKQTYFIKVNQASQIAMFEAEALGLQQISDTGAIRTPKPLCTGISADCCYIVMEYLSMGNRKSRSFMEMGRNLAKMHKKVNISQKGFGWYMQNTIGSTPQINTWTDNWGEFYAQNRLGYQFRLGIKRGGDFPQAEELIAKTPKLLGDYKPQPSLIHGDLWIGNTGFTIDGEPVVFDPATYYGDREVDIAMTELFGGFPCDFYQGYNEVFMLDSGYKNRRILYGLYHIINHFNLFGGGYESQVNRMIRQIIT